jgi:single-stranded-DNA-specific exonuclease
VVAPPITDAYSAQFKDIAPVVLQLLYNRGLRAPAEAAEFLNPAQGLDGNPFKLTGMNEAVTRIRQAIRQGEPIAVYGDYDVDGVTATALLVQTLRALGAHARPYIPHRVEEGYGLNMTALERLLKEQETRLVITVDCGVRSSKEVAHANKLGIDMIITDHHALGEELPPARAVINPRQPGNRYPGDELAGVGLAYKLAQGLLRAHEQLPATNICSTALPDEKELLDLVALGTVADVAPLLGENRRLVWEGLRLLNEARRPGVRALLAEAKVAPGAVTAHTIGYVLGPRLNAAGRLDSAIASYKLLASADPAEAETLARELGERNRERQQLTRALTEQARAEVLEKELPPIILVRGEEYMSGVAGLVASRLAEEFYRPTIVLERGAEASKGSARSIPEFHITQALDGCADLLLKHGGHAAAAGLTIRNERWEEFVARLTEIARQQLATLDPSPQLAIDAQIPLAHADWALMQMLPQLEPCGQKNPTPLFLSEGVAVRDARVVGSSHLKLTLHDGRSDRDAIAFGQGEWVKQMSPRLDVVYSLGENEWNGQKRLQLLVRDLRPAKD